MNNLYEILEKSSLVKGNATNIDKFNSLSFSKLISISEKLADASTSITQEESCEFMHCASRNLSGDPYECHKIDCRVSRVMSLSRFALLNSNRVYIYNYFDDFYCLSKKDEEWFRKVLFGNIVLSLALRPLFKEGIIAFSPVRGIACPECLAKIINGKAGRKQETRRAIKSLSSDILKNLRSIISPTPKPHIQIQSNEYLDCVKVLPLDNAPKWIKKYLNDRERSFPKSALERLRFHDRRAALTYHDVSFLLTLSNKLSISPLFDNPSQIKLINKISHDQDINRKNMLAAEHMTISMQFAENVKLKDLLRLRKKEPEAFNRFQYALRKGMKELKNTKNPRRKDVNEIYAEIVAPELSRLDLVFKRAKKNLFTDVVRTAVSGVGAALSVGFISGAITNKLVPMLAGAIFTDNLIKSGMASMDAERELERDDFYFAWRAKEMTRS